MEDRLLKIEEVAKRMGVSRTWIYKKCRAGILPHFRIGRMIRFDPEDLEKWIQDHKVKGTLKI